MRQKEMSFWLKGTTLAASAILIILCGFVLPAVGKDFVNSAPSIAYLYWPCLIYVWTSMIPIGIAFFLAWRIFDAIGTDKSFTAENARRLKKISGLAIFEAVLYVAGLIVLLAIGKTHPSIFVAVLFILFACVTVSVLCAVLSHIVQSASEIKQENDLTV